MEHADELEWAVLPLPESRVTDHPKTRILIYATNFSPELTGIGKYTGEMATWLSDEGYDVRVICAPPYYPQWKVQKPYRAWRYQRETLNGAQVFRTPLWVPGKPTGLKRVLHLLSFVLFSIPVLIAQLRWKPQVVWLVEPTLFVAPAALMFARATGAKTWLHIQDFEIDAAFELGLLKGERPRRWADAFERWVMNRCDRVSTISSRMFERARAKGVALSKLVSFPNWVDIDAIQPLKAASPFRTQLGIDQDATVALYSGNMGAKQGLEVLAETARLLSGDSSVQFVFCGGGSGRKLLMEQCEGLTNVRFMDLQPMEWLGDLLGMADIHLLPQRADAADLVMPSKLTGMLASGRPVIAAASPGTEIARVLNGCGIVVPPERADILAEAVLKLAGQPEQRVALGLAARAYAELELNRDSILTRFDGHLRAMH
ncbi:MAG: glycosyltransferase WbuB [Panacagrimonas sp.]